MKRIIKILSVLLMVAMIFIACGKISPEGDITGYSRRWSVVDRIVPSFTVDADGDFTLLQFTDTHLISGSTKKDMKTLEKMKTQIEKNTPDLVVITGDMVEGNNKNKNYNKKEALETVGTLMESLQQYWAYVPGNNDGEFMGSSDEIVSFLSQYKHCILSNKENLTGATQYSIDLKKSGGEVVHSLIFMDSLQRNEMNVYDCMKEDQAEWLSKTLNEKNVKTSLFFHMNTPDFTNSAKLGEAYSENYAEVPEILVNNIPGNDKIDKVINEAGNVGLVSIGHIHPEDNWCSFYDGRYYHVTRASGYYVSKKPGCTLITIHTFDSDIKLMYDFVEIEF